MDTYHSNYLNAQEFKFIIYYNFLLVSMQVVYIGTQS